MKETMKILTAQAFGLALCERFGIPSKQVQDSIKMHTGVNELFSVTLTLMLGSEDLAVIAAIMKRNEAPKTA